MPSHRNSRDINWETISFFVSIKEFLKVSPSSSNTIRSKADGRRHEITFWTYLCMAVHGHTFCRPFAFSLECASASLVHLSDLKVGNFKTVVVSTVVAELVHSLCLTIHKNPQRSITECSLHEFCSLQHKSNFTLRTITRVHVPGRKLTTHTAENVSFKPAGNEYDINRLRMHKKSYISHARWKSMIIAWDIHIQGR